MSQSDRTQWTLEEVRAELRDEGWTWAVEAIDRHFAAERERYAKLEADYDKLTEMYERALREREDGP